MHNVKCVISIEKCAFICTASLIDITKSGKRKQYGVIMHKQGYLLSLHKQINQLYTAVKAGEPQDKARYRIEGFLHAGRQLGLIDEQEANLLFETIHKQIFNETIEHRTKRKGKLDQLKIDNPDEYFAIPAIERRN
jgi:hypothetical protein